MGDSDDSTETSSERSGQRVTCEQCGDTIDTTEWYPVAKRRDGDGSLRLHQFCSDSCRNEWDDEQSD